MKLMNTPTDVPAVDPRSRGASRPSSDTSSNDNQPAPFDGVLADVGTNAKAASAADLAAKKADASVTASTSATSDAAGGDSTILGALVGILGKGALQGTANAEASTKSGTTPDDDADSQNAVDSLLKRMSKDSATSDPAGSNATATPTTPTDVMSILMLGAGLASAQPAPTATSVDATKLATAAAVLGAADKSAQAKTEDATSAAADMEVVVSDVAVATHLAPATTGPGKAGLTGDLKSNAAHQAGETSGAVVPPAAATAHAGPDDGSSSPRQDADPTATSSGILSSGAMNASLAPVRSIATAIGELAAQPAPAATVPDASKPALGVARTMTLQMSPADLGTVGIRMHITGQTLDVQLTISDPQTLGMVSRERNTLATALHDQHYELNSLVIQDGGAAASSGGNNAATQGDTSGSSARPDRQSGNASSDTQGGSRQGQGQDAGQPARDDRRQSRDSTPRSVADSRGGGLFV